MTVYRRWAVLLTATAYSLTCLGNAQNTNRLQVKANGILTYADYRYWSGHPYLRLKDTAGRFGWYPQQDGYHRLADIARCVRLDYNTTNIYRISYEPLIGKNAIAGVDKLPPLAVPTRLVQNELWIPIDAVAKTMGYTISFSQKQQLLELTSPASPEPGTLEYDCQQFIIKAGAP